MAVKLKFQSPNWQMQRNALLLCFEVVIVVWLAFLRLKAIAASYRRVSVELALWSFPPLCCWRLLSVLLRTFFFKFFCFLFSFFGRTLASNASLCRCTGALSPLKPELKKTHADDWSAAQLQTDSQNAHDISSAPLSSEGLKRRSSVREGTYASDVVYTDRFIPRFVNPKCLCICIPRPVVYCRPITRRHERAAGRYIDGTCS